MPKIETTLTEDVESPEVGVVYTIGDVEEFTSQVRSFKGYRVNLKDAEGKEVVETLWKQEVSTPQSKIGAYVSALGYDTDTWKGKKIRYDTWSRGNRKVIVVRPTV